MATNTITSEVCRYCRQPLAGSMKVVVCSACGVPHHESCWNFLGHCTTSECIGFPVEAVEIVDLTQLQTPAVSAVADVEYEEPASRIRISSILLDVDLGTALACARDALAGHVGLIFGAFLLFIVFCAPLAIPYVTIPYALLFMPLLIGGAITFTRKLYYGEDPGISDLFSQFPAAPRWLLAGLVSWLIPLGALAPFAVSVFIAVFTMKVTLTTLFSSPSTIGFMVIGALVSLCLFCCYFPRWMFAMYFVEEGEEALDAFRASWYLTEGWSGTLLPSVIVFALLLLAGIALALVGLVVAVPLVLYATLYLYTALKSRMLQ